MESRNVLSSAPEKKAPATFLLVIVLYFSLLSSVIEVMVHLWKRQWGHSWYLRLSRDFAWMTPITDAVIFLIPGLVLSLLAWRFRRVNFIPATVFVGAFLFFGKCLILTGQLHDAAILLLALGLGVQTARLCKNRILRWKPAMENFLACMVLMFTVLGSFLFGYRLHAEVQFISQMPPVSRDAPNIILITLDTVGADHLSLYGYARQTSPNLDKWARQGACFKKAFATAPWTLPSHASMFTGRYPHELSTTWKTPLDNQYPTVAEVLRDHAMSLTVAAIHTT